MMSIHFAYPSLEITPSAKLCSKLQQAVPGTSHCLYAYNSSRVYIHQVVCFARANLEKKKLHPVLANDHHFPGLVGPLRQPFRPEQDGSASALLRPLAPYQVSRYFS